jgi:hypothetical protein
MTGILYYLVEKIITVMDGGVYIVGGNIWKILFEFIL